MVGLYVKTVVVGDNEYSNVPVEGLVELGCSVEEVEVLTAKALADKKLSEISTYIYKYYSAIKQAQDQKWASSYTVKLKAAGVVNLESLVVGSVGRLAGETLGVVANDVVSGFDAGVISNIQGDTEVMRIGYAESMLSKLIKIAVKTEWAELCIVEGKAAIAENRDPVYPSFPVFE